MAHRRRPVVRVRPMPGLVRFTGIRGKHGHAWLQQHGIGLDATWLAFNGEQSKWFADRKPATDWIMSARMVGTVQ